MPSPISLINLDLVRILGSGGLNLDSGSRYGYGNEDISELSNQASGALYESNVYSLPGGNTTAQLVARLPRRFDRYKDASHGLVVSVIFVELESPGRSTGPEIVTYSVVKLVPSFEDNDGSIGVRRV